MNSLLLYNIYFLIQNSSSLFGKTFQNVEVILCGFYKPSLHFEGAK